MRCFMQMPSQQIRFSGDLTKVVSAGVPPFNGTEAALLRCTCASILHANAIVPRGMYVKEEADEEAEIRPKIEDLEQIER